MGSVEWTQAAMRAIKKHITLVDAIISTGQGFVQIRLNGDRIDDMRAFTKELPRHTLSLTSEFSSSLAPSATVLIITESGITSIWHRRSEFHIMFISLFLSLLIKYWDTVYAYVSMVVYGLNTTSI